MHPAHGVQCVGQRPIAIMNPPEPPTSAAPCPVRVSLAAFVIADGRCGHAGPLRRIGQFKTALAARTSERLICSFGTIAQGLSYQAHPDLDQNLLYCLIWIR